MIGGHFTFVAPPLEIEQKANKTLGTDDFSQIYFY